MGCRHEIDVDLDLFHRLILQPSGFRAPAILSPLTAGRMGFAIVSLDQSASGPPYFQGHIINKLAGSRRRSVTKWRTIRRLRRLNALKSFSLDEFREIQQKALKEIVLGKDVLVILPTGSGKSLIFQTAPLVYFARLSGR
ncbi:hypothetical protein AC249_AIPGENE16241 [Exaiptasia diaphana]|nr:hypothetical protein AC249_AIPGENE16241 [Exaiptasia diaphana]